MKMVRPYTNRSLLGTCMLLLIAALALAPVALMLINSFKSDAAIIRNPLALPRTFDFANFVSAWTEGDFAVGLRNSVLLCAATAFLTISAAALAAYPLARSRAAAMRVLGLLILCSVTVPIQLFLFPLFFIFARLHLVGNIIGTALILSAINMPMAVLLLRTYVLTIPLELDDAAVIDGATRFQIFRYVVLPLIRPGLITVAILVSLNVWNEYLVTSTFQQGQQHFTMTLDYLAMNGTITANQGLLMAGGVLVVIPMLLVFLATQRFIIAGLTAGAVKG
jgi:raffinose/stachyose/melibiose transport system permease protein